MHYESSEMKIGAVQCQLPVQQQGHGGQVASGFDEESTINTGRKG